MNQTTQAFCRRVILEQLSQCSAIHIHSEVVSQKISDTTYRASKEDAAVESQEIALSFTLNRFCQIGSASRKQELEKLLEKVDKNQFSLLCRCGVPITFAMFEAHASEECPSCRSKLVKKSW